MMCELLVEGGERLYGELTIQGSKNSVLPILAATLLCADTCVIENCPKLRDVDASVAILRHLGCCTHWEDSALVVDTARMDRAVVPDALMREMRSSVIFLGAILARCQGSDDLLSRRLRAGAASIDLHLSALSALGAEIRETGGELKCLRRNASRERCVLTHAERGRDGKRAPLRLRRRRRDDDLQRRARAGDRRFTELYQRDGRQRPRRGRFNHHSRGKARAARREIPHHRRPHRGRDVSLRRGLLWGRGAPSRCRPAAAFDCVRRAERGGLHGQKRGGRCFPPK